MAPPPLQVKSMARPRSCIDWPGRAVGRAAGAGRRVVDVGAAVALAGLDLALRGAVAAAAQGDAVGRRRVEQALHVVDDRRGHADGAAAGARGQTGGHVADRAAPAAAAGPGAACRRCGHGRSPPRRIWRGQLGVEAGQVLGLGQGVVEAALDLVGERGLLVWAALSSAEPVGGLGLLRRRPAGWPRRPAPAGPRGPPAAALSWSRRSASLVFWSSRSARRSAASPGSAVSMAAMASSPGGCTKAWTANSRTSFFSSSISACLAVTAACAAAVRGLRLGLGPLGLAHAGLLAGDVGVEVGEGPVDLGLGGLQGVRPHRRPWPSGPGPWPARRTGRRAGAGLRRWSDRPRRRTRRGHRDPAPRCAEMAFGTARASWTSQIGDKQQQPHGPRWAQEPQAPQEPHGSERQSRPGGHGIVTMDGSPVTSGPACPMAVPDSGDVARPHRRHGRGRHRHPGRPRPPQRPHPPHGHRDLRHLRPARGRPRRRGRRDHRRRRGVLRRRRPLAPVRLGRRRRRSRACGRSTRGSCASAARRSRRSPRSTGPPSAPA